MRIKITPRIVPVLFLCAFLAFLFSCTPSPRTPPPPINLVTIPTQLNFFAKPGTDPASESLDIGVANRISAAWSAGADQTWLSTEPASGETPRNFSGALPVDRTAVSVDASGLLPGTYSANISIDAEGVIAKMVPVRLYVTDAQPGQKIDAGVAPGEGNAWGAGINIDGPLEVSVAMWDHSLYIPNPQQGLEYGQGDLIILVAGTFSNVSDNDCQVEYWAEGLDTDGDTASVSLDPGMPVGHLLVPIPKESSKTFTLHLSWADNITRITIGANRYDTVTPLPY